MTKKLIYLLVIGALMAAFIASGASAKSQAALDPGTKFYVPKVNKGATEQIADLTSSGNKADANLIKQLVQTPQAVWFTKGTPKTVMQDVRNTVERAAAKGTVPVLVAYNIPFRDCAQYSAGGATSVAEYEAWIDGFAAGISNKKAVVILEPDSLGIIPWYTNIDGGQDWCQPGEADPATAASDRFLMLNYAVDAFKALANVSVYLDGTHSSWLNVADNAKRLITAGVQRADGFYLNVSNYQFTSNSIAYGSWVSKCITYVTMVDPGNYGSCGNQYWNGGPATGWDGAGMDRYQEWRNEPYSGNHADLSWNTVGIDSRYDMILGGVQPTTHFVIDTSRNGQGPWLPATNYPDAQDWCNPPDRGLGYRPTAHTGVTLVDAYLWVKLPGESDGQCTRGTDSTGTVDPERGIIDPAAGVWFPDMALELVHNANPPMP
ncbi:MAG: glycoside hydrolase family 6 protein [Bacteroidota bacterium]